jgi:hypothetical protein
MLNDITDPLADYSEQFKELHAQNVSEYFEQLVETAEVDAEANRATIAALRHIQKELAGSKSRRSWWRFAQISLIAIAIILGFIAFQNSGWYFLLMLPAIGLIVFVFMHVNKVIRGLNESVDELSERESEKLDEAWAQLEPLNSLHQWEVAQTLFQRTLPQFTLDRYLAAERLADLRNTYGLGDQFNDGRSVLFAQSGSFKENPFAIARFLEHWIGTKTYFGSLVIYWTEQQRNANGEWATVQRSQTLTASVVKPFPEYQNRTGIIYGHDAAPNLSFSRLPSKLSGLSESAFTSWRVNNKVKHVERKSRKAIKTGSSGLTVMANRDFEALFNAIDRDDEIEFRLLFTPLAQLEMVNLMKDQEIAYGDDFAFSKFGQINFVEPAHLSSIEFDGNPTMFKFFDIDESRDFFNQFHNEYFKSLYFGFAPILSIPLYQEGRSVPKIAQPKFALGTSVWEHEAIANFIGESSFAHVDSVTRNLLKTEINKADDRNATVRVTAFGYEGIPRIDFIPVRGGDGNIHEVPVEWIEYLPVERQSQMLVGISSDVSQESSPGNTWDKYVKKSGGDLDATVSRGILTALLLN